MMEINKIYQGNALEVLHTFPDESINCVMTSPPYWALRDYGIEGQIGLEKTFQEYITKLCDIFDEVKRVLRKDGTCWVNMGDTYASNGSDRWDKKNYGGLGEKQVDTRILGRGRTKEIIAKCLMMIPERFAIEMINRGWILRNVIIWHKPNAMPSSVKDRFNVDFEYLFFFVKNKRYFFETQYESHTSMEDYNRRHIKLKKGNLEHPRSDLHSDSDGNFRDRIEFYGENGRNKRTVWTITTKGFPESHFAVYPEELCETPLKAGCPEFVCNKCGKPREKIMKSDNPSKEFMEWDENRMSGAPNSFQTRQCIKSLHRNDGGVYSTAKFKGWKECNCNAGFSGGIVLDPFIGAGTTLLVALKQNKRGIGIEINPEYINIANKRLKPYLTQTKLNDNGGTNFTKSSADDFPYQESLIIAKSDKSSAEDLPSPETAVSASPKGEFS